MKMVSLFDFKIDKFPFIGKGKMLTAPEPKAIWGHN